MHLTCIPRHRLELTLADYAAIVRDCLWTPDHAVATREFESRFADYLGCRHAIAVPSGRVGLALLLGRLNLSPGDEAIIPAFNLHAVIEQFVRLGLTPKLCDIRSSDLNIDPAAVEQRITPSTRVLLATHMFGHAADMSALVDLANRHDLILLEDCAHALGTRFAGRCAGTFGKAAIFSFSVLKLVTTFGGGMVTTDDDTLAAGIRDDLTWRVQPCCRTTALKRFVVGAALDFGTRRWPFSLASWPAFRAARLLRPDIQKRIMTETPPRTPNAQSPKQSKGFPCALHPFQLRLGHRQLARSDEFIRTRRRIDAWLDHEWKDLPEARPLRPGADSQPNGLYYGLLADRPDELANELFKHGVDAETSEYRNCAALDTEPSLAADCPVARSVESRIIRLPNHPGVTRDDVRRIGRLVRRFYAQRPTGEIVRTAERTTNGCALKPRAFDRPRSRTVPIVGPTSAPESD